jgi:hypothetical protein
MEVAPITFGTFRTVFLHNEASLVSIPRLIRDFSCRHSLHSRTAMIFMIVTLVFILVFPTFGSAMTGYSAGVQPYVQDQEHNYIPFDNFIPSDNARKTWVAANQTYSRTDIQEKGICQAQKVCKHSRPTYSHLLILLHC